MISITCPSSKATCFKFAIEQNKWSCFAFRRKILSSTWTHGLNLLTRMLKDLASESLNAKLDSDFARKPSRNQTNRLRINCGVFSPPETQSCRGCFYALICMVKQLEATGSNWILGKPAPCSASLARCHYISATSAAVSRLKSIQQVHSATQFNNAA